MTRWVNNFPQKCQFKSFDQWNLTLIFCPYKPELSMIRSCLNRLEFKNECYSTDCKPVNQQKTSIFALILWEEQRLNFHFRPPKKCPPFFLIHTWWCENITASPCGVRNKKKSCIESLAIKLKKLKWEYSLSCVSFKIVAIINSLVETNVFLYTMYII